MVYRKDASFGKMAASMTINSPIVLKCRDEEKALESQTCTLCQGLGK